MKSWSFVGVLVAIVFGAWGVWSVLYYERHPNLSLEIVSNTRIFEIREKIEDLDVLYKSESIVGKGQMLSVILARFSNTGQAPILKTYYDSADPCGLVIKNGTVVVPPRLVDQSNEYFSRALRMRQPTNDSLFFGSIIIDDGSYFTLKLLVLHADTLSPTIEPTGTIAGVNEIETLDKAGGGTGPGKLVNTVYVMMMSIVLFPVIIMITCRLIGFLSGWEVNSISEIYRWLRIQGFLERDPHYRELEDRIMIRKAYIKFDSKSLSEVVTVACMEPQNFSFYEYVKYRVPIENATEVGVINSVRNQDLIINWRLVVLLVRIYSHFYSDFESMLSKETQDELYRQKLLLNKVSLRPDNPPSP